MYCILLFNFSYDLFKINLKSNLCVVNKMRLTVEAIPTPKGFQHPAAKHDALPRHEFR